MQKTFKVKIEDQLLYHIDINSWTQIVAYETIFFFLLAIIPPFSISQCSLIFVLRDYEESLTKTLLRFDTRQKVNHQHKLEKTHSQISIICYLSHFKLRLINIRTKDKESKQALKKQERSWKDINNMYFCLFTLIKTLNYLELKN